MARQPHEIADEIEATRAEYQAIAGSKPETEARPLLVKVKDLQAELSSVLSVGAEDCEVCGNAPLGMRQYGSLNGRAVMFYEVGCLVCKDRRAQGFTREEAVKNWNAESFLPAKDQVA
jgi:hypothetical protein